MSDDAWPALDYAAWRDTATTLHMWTQIVGKVRLTLTPWLNHSWHVVLYVTARGLTTSPIAHGSRSFEIDFDFVDHQLVIKCTDRATRTIPLHAMAVADFYQQVMGALDEMDLHVRITGTPNEVEQPTPFAQDRQHASYDPEYANRFWRVLLQSDRVFKIFRSEFIGKCSPVHFFWGSFDLAVTRFSGRTAPPHPGGVPNLPDDVAREAYSHEVSSCGFWPGSEAMPQPVYYSYAYPAPNGFADAEVLPAAASWNTTLREFILPYDAVRNAASPDETLLEFMRSTYQAAARLGGWDRVGLAAPGTWPGRVRSETAPAD